MKRSLIIALSLFALIGGIAPWTATLAQWGPPPGGASSAPAWPSGPQGAAPGGAPSGGAAWPSGPPGGPPGGPAGNSQADKCADFPRIGAETKKKADAVQAAINAKADRKQVCALMTSFTAAEAALIKFLEDNKTWCGVPDQAIAGQKAGHEKSLKFKTMACSDAPGAQQKPATLSDAIKMPKVDSSANTKTGRGTFDTLTGNPLAR
jgi:hypothetical protein